MPNVTLMSVYKLESIIKEAGVAYHTSSGMQLVDLARKGISKQSLLQLSEVAGLTLKEIANLLPVSLRTIQRCSKDDLLDPSVSEHVLLIAELIADAGNIFNSAEDVQSWLKSPLIGLGGIEPVTLLDTSFGIRLVREELGRLEYGVYS
jgi:putative toxin-antitoxin system antitoxin component (TIGR02293 family)